MSDLIIVQIVHNSRERHCCISHKCGATHCRYRVLSSCRLLCALNVTRSSSSVRLILTNTVLCLRYICVCVFAGMCMQTGGSGSVEQAPMADEPDAKMSTFISESVSTSAR
jgi:hypothetical protein